MRSMFSLEEIGDMLDMKPSELEKEMTGGDLSFTYHEGEKMVTLYDLEKYMGEGHTRKIVREYFKDGKS